LHHRFLEENQTPKEFHKRARKIYHVEREDIQHYPVKINSGKYHKHG